MLTLLAEKSNNFPTLNTAEGQRGCIGSGPSGTTVNAPAALLVETTISPFSFRRRKLYCCGPQVVGVKDRGEMNLLVAQ